MTGPLLTANELAVLRGASEGDTYAVIAARLGLAEKSVSKIAFRLARKLGARNITHAVWLACQTDVLEPKRRHGDHAGYLQHRRRGEDACDACKAANGRYSGARKAQRRRRRDAPAAPDGTAAGPRGAPGARLSPELAPHAPILTRPRERQRGAQPRRSANPARKEAP